MPLQFRLTALLLSLLAVPVLQARDKPYLPPEVEKVLEQRRIPDTSLSVFVREVGRDEPLVSFNSAVPRNPASTMKLLTTYAALEMLGPAYTWYTRAYATGPIRNQVLEGDLVLVGGGDPFLTVDRWWNFVNGIRQLGVQRVTGNVVIDNSYFAPQGDDRAAFDNRPYRTYNVLPDALLVNFQTVSLSLVPDPDGGAARVSAYPWPSNLTIDNNVKVQRGACKRVSGGVAIATPDGPSGNRLSVGGLYASGCGPLVVNRAVMRAPDYAFGTFRSFWQQSGGELGKEYRIGTLPPNAKLLYTLDSLTLSEVIRLINKFSSNAMARHLLLTIAAERGGRPATTTAGRQAIMDWLASKEISIPDLVVENGSGLSRIERISAAGLAEVLTSAHGSQFMPEFAASLPLSAMDGTLRRRFRSPEMQGRLRMKTGSLEDVSALAGYVNAASGKTFVAVIILNHPVADEGAGEALQAALIQWVFGQ